MSRKRRFSNAHRALRHGVQPMDHRAWLLTIARNVCRSRFRTLCRRPREEPLDESLFQPIPEEDESAPLVTRVRSKGCCHANGLHSSCRRSKDARRPRSGRNSASGPPPSMLSSSAPAPRSATSCGPKRSTRAARTPRPSCNGSSATSSTATSRPGCGRISAAAHPARRMHGGSVPGSGRVAAGAAMGARAPPRAACSARVVRAVKVVSTLGALTIGTTVAVESGPRWLGGPKTPAQHPCR